MFRYISKVFNSLYLQVLNSSSSAKNHRISPELVLSYDLNQNIEKIKNVFAANNDIIFREFAFGNNQTLRGALIYIDGLTDHTIINENIIKPLMYDSQFVSPVFTGANNNVEMIRKAMVAVGSVHEVTNINEAVDSCLAGDTVFLINGSQKALVIGSRAWEARSIEEPNTESVVRGPREGFTETLRTNTTMLRRKIRNPNLAFETITLGRQTNTDVCIAYLKGVVNPRLIGEIRRRLKRIKTDAILESGYIEQFIEDEPFSPFPTIANSERPDRIAAKILDGRAAIFIDGSPCVLTVPMVFIEIFQSPEDYYSRPYLSSMIRLLRFMSFFISTLAPATYVALTTFHQELIPTPLLINMAFAREGTPFPVVVEALGMGMVFEMLREAGVRLPRPVGQTISIVGALVIGQAAVQAGLVDAPMIIMVSITAIAAFVVTAIHDAGLFLRLVFVILAAVLGGFGIMIGAAYLLVYLASLRSFGTPYLSPLAPLTLRDLKDTFIRAPLWTLSYRPRTIGWHNPRRQKSGLKPSHPDENKK